MKKGSVTKSNLNIPERTAPSGGFNPESFLDKREVTSQVFNKKFQYKKHYAKRKQVIVTIIFLNISFLL